MWWLEQWEGQAPVLSHIMMMMIQLCHYPLQALSLSLSPDSLIYSGPAQTVFLLQERQQLVARDRCVCHQALDSSGVKGDHYCHLFEVIAIYNIHGSASNNSSSTCFFPSEDWMEFYKAKLHNLMASYRDIAFFSSHCESSL